MKITDLVKGGYWRSGGAAAATLIGSNAKSVQTTPFTLYILFGAEVSGLTSDDISVTGATLGTPSTSDNLLYEVTVTPTLLTTSISLSVPLGDGYSASNTLNINSADADYVALLSRISALEYTLPSVAERVNNNAQVVWFKDKGIWDELDVMWVTDTDGGQDSATLNWKSPSTKQLSRQGTMVFSDGYASNGTTGYLTTGWSPSVDGVKFTLNDASVIIYLRNKGISTTKYDHGSNVGSLVACNFRRTTSAARIAINQSTNADISCPTTDGVHHAYRDASNSIGLSHNGGSPSTASNASTSLSTGEQLVNALDNAGTPSLFSDRENGFLAYGSNLLAKKSEVSIGVQSMLLTDESIDAVVENVDSTIDSGVDDIYMRCFYKTKANQPLLILIAGYTQTATDFLDATYQRFRDYGFFVVGVGMRGRNGATGTADDAARELHDVYDAVNHIKEKFAGLIDTTKVSIVGYSGGGGVTYGMVSKFPDLFACAVVCFGISDYGYDGTYGWWAEEPSRQATLEARIGDTPANAPNEYKSRQHLVSISNFTGKLYIFHDVDDTLVHVDNSTRVVTQLIADGFSNYVYDETDSGDATRWLHDLPNGANSIVNAEDVFKADLLALTIQGMPSSGTVVVNGYLKCSLFEIWLGNGTTAEDGQNRRATLAYNYITNSYTLTPSIDSPETELTYSFTDNTGRSSSGTISSETSFTPS